MVFASSPEFRDDLVLEMVSEPLPHPPFPSAKTDSRPESDLDLDVTLEPKETPFEEEEQDGCSREEPVASQNQAMSKELQFVLIYLLNKLKNVNCLKVF